MKMLRAFFTDMRKFILKLDAFLLIAGYVFLHLRGKAYGCWVVFCFCFLLFAVVFPSLFQPLRKFLHKVSHWWGGVVTFFILAVVYFLVLVPLGLLARLFGKEFLALKSSPKEVTYWIRREKPAGEKSAGERQY